MRRRDFITLLGSAAAWPVAARAQQPRPLIGYVSTGSFATNADSLPAFRRGLGETGFVEGRSVTVDYRWADEVYERVPALFDELVRPQASVIGGDRIAYGCAGGGTGAACGAGTGIGRMPGARKGIPPRPPKLKKGRGGRQ